MQNVCCHELFHSVNNICHHVHLSMRYIRCHIVCILEQLQMKLINDFLLFNVFVKKYGGMTMAIKVEFLRNVSFFLSQKRSFKKRFLFSIQNFEFINKLKISLMKN